ncbi:aldo/keto reductase [Lachnospiraceae bacterium C1.1]|nr:aldo/keto reductase [Lachnospiraceae bacterium C1.1]
MENEIKLRNGMLMPRLGMGTWYIGEDRASEKEEIEAIRAGLDAGQSLIDTAEMYGNGAAERLVGKAIEGYSRDKLFLVSKVLPYNAGRKNIFDSLEASLKRMGTDYLDLYLLHWIGSVPFEETVECMEKMVKDGKIRSWGVSNFDTSDMKELFDIENGTNCVVNQDLYHLGSRGIEFDLLPWMRENNVALMAYCPLAQGGDLRSELLSNESVKNVASKHGISEIQTLLAFVLHEKNAIAIPRSGKKEHVLANWEVRNIELDEEDMDLLNRAYPKPNRKMHLDVV